MCQMFCRSFLIWGQTVCKGYQQMTKIAAIPRKGLLHEKKLDPDQTAPYGIA